MYSGLEETMLVSWDNVRRTAQIKVMFLFRGREILSTRHSR